MLFFWHPFLLHGSSSQRSKGFTRKSLTAHYHPKKYLRSNGKKDPEINKEIYNHQLKRQVSLSRDLVTQFQIDGLEEKLRFTL